MAGKKARGDPQRRAASQSSVRTRTHPNAGRKKPGKPPHVVILGAGIAGLCAAYELEQRGWTTTILEAERHHVGGRVRTVRFSDGQYSEFGAMRIPEKHNWTLHYARQFGLQLRPFVIENDAAYYHVRGRASAGEIGSRSTTPSACRERKGARSQVNSGIRRWSAF
jgi:monoamine oxidase